MKTNNILRRIGGVLAGALLLPAIAWADSTALDCLEVRADGRNLVENFSSATTGYEVKLNAPVTVTLSAVPQSKTATVEISVNSDKYTNHSVAPLRNGANTIVCTVKDGSQTGTYTVSLDATTPHRTIYFKSSWSAQPYVYIYTQTPSDKEFAGEWPGTTMERHDDSWYKFQLDDEADKNAMVIFNTGKNGTDRYPANLQPGVKLDFEGYEGWYVLDEHKFYTSNPDGPQKPVITVSPAGGKVKGSRVISITFAYNPTEVSGTFAGKAIAGLSTSGSTVTVSDYLADGAEGTLTVTAANDEGETTFSGTYTRDDSTPVSTLTGDHRELSIYQIMVASFQRGDSPNAGYTQMWGPDGHRKDGNLRGIINSLEYIKSLGMNAIWMTPVFDSSEGGNGDERLKATGYFANNYFEIDPHFGTKEDFKELVDKCHELGMYVILDGVFGHDSNCNGPSPNNKYIVHGSAMTVRGDQAPIVYPGSLDYFKEVVRYWMDEYEVDGWRLDQCYQVYQGDHNYWKEIREEVEAVCTERKARGEQWGTLGYMVGEDWANAGGINSTKNDGLRSVFDFDGKQNISGDMQSYGSEGLGYGVASIEQTYKSPVDRGYESGVLPNLFLSNHDGYRLADHFADSDPQRYQKMMLRHAILAAYSGPVTVYYGDEYGDLSRNTSGGAKDNIARTSGHLTPNNNNEAALADYISRIFKARSEHPALWRGTVSGRKDDPNNCKVYEVTKTDAETGERVVVVFSSEDKTWDIGGTGVDLINGGAVGSTVSVKAWVPEFILMD